MNIVIVDDEAIVRYGIKHSISWDEVGANRVEEAANGKEVLDSLDEWKPDIIITDIKMPIVDGIELIQLVKELRPECKFIVLSCVNEFDYVKKALMLGASDYLLKMTIRPEEVMACIRKVIGEIEAQHKSKLWPTGLPDEHYKIETFFRDILTYKYTTQQIREIADIYKMRCSLNRFTVAKMKVNMLEASSRFGGDGERLARFSIMNVLKEYASMFDDMDFFKDEDEEYAFIIDWKSDETINGHEERIRERLSKIVELIKRFLKIDVCFGVSGVCGQLERLLTGYREAVKAAERCMFRTNGRIVAYREFSAAPSQGQDKAILLLFNSKFRERIIHALTFGLKDDANATIEYFFNRLKEGSCSSETAQACISKVAAILQVYAMEVSSYESTDEFDPIEQLNDNDFNLYWNCDRTKEKLKSYCMYLIRRKQHLNKNGSKKTIQEIESYIAEHYMEKITLAEVAKHFYINKNYLSQLFKSETSVNFTRYLNDLRISKAKQLITHTADTITEIADKVGYNDFRYFSRVFKIYERMAPSEYKALTNKN